MLDRLTCDDWKALLDDSFRVRLGEGLEQEWRLASVNVWGAATAEHRAPYTLGFLGPQHPRAGQGMLRLEHPALGGLEIFFVPTGPDRKGHMCYEAVFT